MVTAMMTARPVLCPRGTVQQENPRPGAERAAMKKNLTATTLERYSGRVALLGAVEKLWKALRAKHPELPELPPSLNAHYPADPLPETSTDVLVSVLREAVHALAYERGEQVTSRGGRYHNTRFAKLAEEVGLVATQDQNQHGNGWSVVELAHGHGWAKQLAAIDRVLAEHPPSEIEEPPPAAPSSDGRRVAAVCRCVPTQRILLGKGLLEAQVVACRACGELFAAASPGV